MLMKNPFSKAIALEGEICNSPTSTVPCDFTEEMMELCDCCGVRAMVITEVTSGAILTFCKHHFEMLPKNHNLKIKTDKRHELYV